ncbi:MAG: hypothetical protein F6K07_32690, partial [Okeania sp. SIO1H5]|uniref:hypothetical protein n=1 Tax=Okeania sp. SIO1H5 TaxID=2607777 RepID=UPI0013B733D0
MKRKSFSARHLAWVCGALALALITGVQVSLLSSKTTSESFASWKNIGGCGAGGGAGSAGAGKWIGRGASGGLYDVEALSNTTLGGDYNYGSVGLNITTKIGNATTFGTSLSWKSNTFEISEFATSDDDYGTELHQTGGMADLGFSLTQNFGPINQYMLSLSTSLPTGQHDIKRTFDNSKNG